MSALPTDADNAAAAGPEGIPAAADRESESNVKPDRVSVCQLYDND